MRPLAPDLSGGLNRSMQHSSRTRLALKTKAKSLARVRSAGTLPWLGFDRAQPNRSLLPGSIVDSTHWMVLRRPSEPARITGHLELIALIRFIPQIGRRRRGHPLRYFSRRLLRPVPSAPLCPALLKLNGESALVWRYDSRRTEAAKTASQANQLSLRHFRDLIPELLKVKFLKADHGNLATRDSRGRSEAGETLV